jgi:hypothetical protein
MGGTQDFMPKMWHFLRVQGKTPLVLILYKSSQGALWIFEQKMILPRDLIIKDV